VTTEVELRRHLPAPPEEVFRAWTDPELMSQWLTPVGTATASVDLRVGGAFSVVMSGEGTTIEHTGEYLEVEPPHLLVFTWRSPFTGGEPSVVSVRLVPVGPGTELTLVHRQLPADAVESHAGGWGQMLERLERLLTTPAEPPRGMP
jgi:uncharacterized protein YndB with AHSA1/START domain